MSQYRQKEVEAIKASEEKEYRGKYALAKHETLALRCENLEKQLAEAMSMLDNVWYWEGCPDDYRERFEQLKGTSK